MKKLPILIAAYLNYSLAFAQTFPVNNLQVNGNVTGNAGTAPVLITTGATVSTVFTATGLVTTSDLSVQAANTVLANGTASTASPTAFAMPSCVTALEWVNGTGFICNTVGAFTTLSATSNVSINQTTAATSGANQNSPNFNISGNYWTGSASAADTWSMQDSLGTGTNPTSTLNVTHSGSTGFSTIAVPGITTGGVTLTDSRVPAFGPVAATFGTSVNSNTSLFVAQSTNQNAFPDAVIAVGHLESAAAGGSIAPFYGECAMDAAGICEVVEVDTFNSAGTAYASLTPPNRSVGTSQIIPQGFIASAGSRTGYSGNSWAGYDVESNTALWYVGYYVNPAALLSTGYGFALGTLWNVSSTGVMTFTPATMPFDTSPVISVQSTTADKTSGGLVQILNTGASVPTPQKFIRVDSSGNFGVVNSGFTAQIMTLGDTGSVSFAGPVKSAGYTVGTLPAGSQGMRSFVTDATSCTFGTAVTGGGSVVCPVFYNGASWIAG